MKHRRFPLLLLPVLLLGACDDSGPTGPDLSGLEILLVQGAGQAAEPGALLPTPLQVRVQLVSAERGAADIRVRWEVVEGSGAALEHDVSRTDSTGLTSTRLTLGPALGSYRVRAGIVGADVAPVEFHAEAVLAPELTAVPAGTVRPGDTIGLEGRNFSVTPSMNVVTFSGIRGRVVAAATSQLRVEVPPCLPPRDVQVRILLGTLSSNAAALQVEGPPVALLLARGEDRVLGGDGGPRCIHLPSQPGSAYLVVPHSSGTVGGAAYGVSLVGLTRDGVSPSFDFPSPAFPFPAASREARAPGVGGELNSQEAWDVTLRTLEKRLVGEGGEPLGVGPGPAGVSASRAGTVQPQLGDTRKFKVLNRKQEFDNVTAVLRHMREDVLIYVDEAAPTGGFSDSDLGLLAGDFQGTIYPTVTGSFGGVSDLDGNGRVIILLTPKVNQLTEADGEGYVGGFFFGLDLLPGQTGSNGGEIFYALVPDPTGQLGPALPRSVVLTVVPSILAHEFEHMVHFNQRILVSGASHQDGLWLSEAMAQMAEDLVGDAFGAKGAAQRALEFKQGNWSRARRFLQNPSQVSVLASLPPGTLAERGAGWLFLKQLVGQEGNEDLLRNLARSTRTGIDNLTHALGLTHPLIRSWKDLIPDWAGSLYLDGLGVPVRPELTVPGVNLRDVLSQTEGTYPLKPRTFGSSSFSHVGSLWSSAPDYFIITPPAAGGIALGLGAPGGLPPEPAAGFQLLVVRLQ